MERPLNAAVEQMDQVEPAAVGLIGIDAHHLMATLLQPFPRFADLYAIAAAPCAGSSVIDQEDSHDAQCPTAVWGGDGDSGFPG